MGFSLPDALQTALKRLGRNTIGLLISGIVAYFQGDAKLLLLAPIINAIGKFLRSKFNLPNIPF